MRARGLTCILHQEEDLNAKIAKDRQGRKDRRKNLRMISFYEVSTHAPLPPLFILCRGQHRLGSGGGQAASDAEEQGLIRTRAG